MSRRCRLARSVLPFVDGELAADDAVAFEDHLEQCASCEAAVAAQRRLEERLLALPRPGAGLADRGRLHERIRERIGARILATAVEPRRKALSWRRPLLAAAGILLLAALAVVPRWRRSASGPPPTTPPPQQIAKEIAREIADEPTTLPPIVLERPDVSFALLATARDEIARCLAGLPADGDALAAFVAATRPLRAKGVPVMLLLESEILRDPDPALGRAAAGLLADAARTGRLGAIDPGLVPILEAVMRRPDRGDAMLKTLLAIGTPRAWLAVALACEMPHLRHDALVAIAGRRDVVGLPKLQAELVASLRRGEPENVTDALRALAATTESHAHLLAELLRAGVDEQQVSAALERARPDSTQALAAMLPQRGEARRDALLLAPYLREATLVAPIADLVARGDDAAAAADALARLGGPQAAVALARLAADPSLSRSRGRTVASAFASLLARADDLSALLGAAALALAPVEEERPRAALLDLCLAAPDPAGARARLALLACAELPPSERTRLAAELTTRPERTAPERLLAILTDAAAHRADGKADDRLLAALLLLVYANGGDERLIEGVRALGVPLTAARERQIKTTARALVRSPTAPQKLGRLDALLELAP